MSSALLPPSYIPDSPEARPLKEDVLHHHANGTAAEPAVPGTPTAQNSGRHCKIHKPSIEESSTVPPSRDRAAACGWFIAARAGRVINHYHSPALVARGPTCSARNYPQTGRDSLLSEPRHSPDKSEDTCPADGSAQIWQRCADHDLPRVAAEVGDSISTAQFISARLSPEGLLWN